MQISILRFPQDANRWNLVGAYLTLRRDVFIERKDWSLWQAEDLEFEQYDSFDTTYVIAHIGIEVVGGGRLRRADQRTGHGNYRYSYMIRDAVLGMLPGLPRELCFDPPPVDPSTWELTRFVNTAGAGIANAMLGAINDFLFASDAKSCLCLGSPAFLRMARRVGWQAREMGPVCGNKDGRFLVFDLSVVDPARLKDTGLGIDRPLG
ncbi:acyl-homoserine-lactone synthase [Paracoccus laeviglucosivorans]|uniref:acyl-homoserine-lactone synthase n=1 Tax=Paracoccus laeviglucosivorans TaxID=1197861 RepID=UPI00163D950C|nr:acyl-homoserine-lactone synthase [Paracoccus laeviglucosivorans]